MQKKCLISLRCLATAVAAVASIESLAQELLIDCNFEPATIKPTDKDAKAWHDDLGFRRREFVMKLEPPSIVVGPKPEFFWGTPQIEVGQTDVSITWYIKAKPLDRTPKITLKVNRFSGKAFETYEMLNKANQGPMYVHWARFGECDVHTRKF